MALNFFILIFLMSLNDIAVLVENYGISNTIVLEIP